MSSQSPVAKPAKKAVVSKTIESIDDVDVDAEYSTESLEAYTDKV